MFKIASVEIDGFWHRFDAKCTFNPDVNIIIGKNGTGKTTFMNILYAVLAVDIYALEENEFETAKITLISEKQQRTIKATKVEDKQYPFNIVEYQISKTKQRVRLVGFEEHRYPPTIRRRLQEEALNIRHKLESLITVSSLSVYRLRHDDDYEVRDNRGTHVVSPVDYRLEKALAGLTLYQLELSQKAKKISEKLQTDVLASILYDEEDAKDSGYKLQFDKNEEQNSLISAYNQLNSLTTEIKKKIHFHVNAIDETITSITWSNKSNNESTNRKSIDIKPLEALRKTRKIISLSLDAKHTTQKIYLQITNFLTIIKGFITDKTFEFVESGKLTIKTANGEVIGHDRLSSGEKQLIILLVEALLQGCRPHVFLADEPELSLHIAWQRRVIPAVKELNPNAQIIAATHSPEVASKYQNSIIDMERLVNG